MPQAIYSCVYCIFKSSYIGSNQGSKTNVITLNIQQMNVLVTSGNQSILKFSNILKWPPFFCCSVELRFMLYFIIRGIKNSRRRDFCLKHSKSLLGSDVQSSVSTVSIRDLDNLNLVMVVWLWIQANFC